MTALTVLPNLNVHCSAASEAASDARMLLQDAEREEWERVNAARLKLGSGGVEDIEETGEEGEEQEEEQEELQEPEGDSSEDSGGQEAGTQPANGSEGAAAAKPPSLPVTYCQVFHGSFNDGAQLAHIINVMGTPTQREIQDMALPPDHEAKLQQIVRVIEQRLIADGVHVRPQPAAVLTSFSGGSVGRAPRPASAAYASSASSSSSSASADAPLPVEPASSSGGGDSGSFTSSYFNNSTSAHASYSADYAASVANGSSSSSSSNGTPAEAAVGPRILRAKDLASFLARRFVPPDMAELISQMLRWSPADRITASAALRHPAMRACPVLSHTSREEVLMRIFPDRYHANRMAQAEAERQFAQDMQCGYGTELQQPY